MQGMPEDSSPGATRGAPLMATWVREPEDNERHAREYAHTILGVVVKQHPADWLHYGSPAGPRRNQEMVDLRPVEVFAFPLGESRGTRGCMRAWRKPRAST